MSTLQIINFPTIPTDVLNTAEEILSPDRPAPDKFILAPPGSDYRRRVIDEKLRSWLTDNLELSIKFVQYQILASDMPIHKDPSHYVHLYLLESGGENTRLNFFNEDQELIESVSVPIKTWVRFDSHVYHSVTGIEPGKFRIALGIRTPQ